MTTHQIDTDDSRGVERVLAAVAAYADEHGYAPSIRDIATLAGYSSPSYVHHLVDALVRDGRLTRTPGIARSLRVVNKCSH